MSLSDFKDLYNLRKYILTIRFFPLFISMITTLLIYSIHGLFNKYFLISLIFTISCYIFSITWVRFNSKLKFAQNLHKENKFIEEYYLYNQLQTETLWESEKFELNLQKAQLFFQVGNHKRFLELVDELSNKIENYPKKEYFFRLLKAFYHEIKNDWSNAKKELEIIIENSNSNNFRIKAYNNIARIEEIQKNFLSAQSFYEKSFEILKNNPLPSFFPITIHNLLICYGKNNQLSKAEKVFDEYYKLIDKKSSKQLLEYTNDLTHYARQINNKELLLKSYSISNNDVKKLLKDKESFIFEISQLRMKYNDNIDFENYFFNIFTKIQIHEDDFNLIEKLNILVELRHVITQKLRENKIQEIKWIDSYIWYINWNLSLKNEIENELKNIESSLSSIKVFWINQLVQLQKNILPKPKDINEIFDLENLKILTKYIEENISIWKEVKNEPEEINEIIHLIDEIYAYFLETQDFRIITFYNKKIHLYLEKADNLLENNYKNPDFSHYSIAIAYFFLNIKNDEITAKKWINRFDKSKVSLNHYALYLRNWYIYCVEKLKIP